MDTKAKVEGRAGCFLNDGITIICEPSLFIFLKYGMNNLCTVTVQQKERVVETLERVCFQKEKILGCFLEGESFMKLSGKLSLAMGILVVLLCLLGGFSLVQMNKINRASTVIAEEWVPGLIHLEELNTLLSDYRIAEIQYVYADNDAQRSQWERELATLEKKRTERREAYKPFAVLPEAKRLLAQYLDALEIFQRIHNQAMELVRAGKQKEAMVLLTEKSLEAYNTMSEILRTLVNIRQDNVKQASEEGDAEYASSRTFTLGLLLFSLFLAVGVAVVIIRGTLLQLGKDPGMLGNIAKRVTGGDYDIDRKSVV